ncbi:hypothetical protein FisN_22Lh031 [Fistulifera solaris]|uniref:VLRF1 domain-containing protein n=1 Tax=Fistulifera solaris TaxID=1519565 RepID=A0A1Z5JC84_FISSO|nr:hypothetical protein FisN_22Lh031 [Fistulifera solaris]|eukprot:GAX11361.1 hypothetical protein FisN_22Lh031 [Fistulifera solaris]
MTLALHTEECQLLLQQALEVAALGDSTVPKHPKSRYADSSSDDEDIEDSSSSSEEDLGDTKEADTPETEPPNLVVEHVPQRPQREKKKKKHTNLEMSQRQREQIIQKHFESLTCEYFPLFNDKQLKIPSILFPKDETTVSWIHHLSLQLQEQPVVVLALRSGRFAGAVFLEEKCVVHTTSQRYTVRKGQGKAQSSQDNAGAAPKSMGAQLRRHGEMQLQQDIVQTFKKWKHYLETAALILISSPKTMKRQLFVEALQSEDRRIRRVPLDMGRPSFEAVSLIYAILTRIKVEDAPLPLSNHLSEKPLVDHPEECAPDNIDETISISPQVEIITLTRLHEAARDGNVELLEELLEAESSDVNSVAGEDLMTPLHYAAQSDALTASACVALLLEKGRANPCQLDRRNRVPYYLSSHDKVRDAFRMCRAALGEEYCSWDAGAKVGPPLTEDDLRTRKEREAEKRRRKKSRQKEKQAKEKAHVAQAEQARQEEEARQKEEEEAKRVRDGLAPKKGGANACDFCQTVCRKKSQMFQRLTYSYCSTDCVNKHKRELMASAALARFG